jgi:hypothetical protein
VKEGQKAAGKARDGEGHYACKFVFQSDLYGCVCVNSYHAGCITCVMLRFMGDTAYSGQVRHRRQVLLQCFVDTSTTGYT